MKMKQISTQKTICIILLFLFLAGVPGLTFGNTDKFTIFRIEIEDTKGENASSEPVKDFYINGGKDNGLDGLMVLDVYRDKTVRDINIGEDITFSVPVGKVKIYNVFKNVATTRIVSLTSSDEVPILEYRTIMVGDYAVLKKEKKSLGILFPSKVLFNLSKWDLKPEAKKALSSVYNTFNKAKDKDIIIEGHTCSLGKEKNNLELSKKRAQSVADYLKKSKGLSEKNILVKYYGESSPIASNETKEGREKNRRVVIRFVPHK